MRKCLPWWLTILLIACQPVEQPVNTEWHDINPIDWALMSNQPYPFTVDYGELYCDDVTKAIFFYPLDTSNDENAIGLPLNEAAKQLIERSRLRANVNITFKDNMNMKRLKHEVKGICNSRGKNK